MDKLPLLRWKPKSTKDKRLKWEKEAGTVMCAGPIDEKPFLELAEQTATSAHVMINGTSVSAP